MRNLNDLNSILFDQLDRLSASDLEGDRLANEIQRTDAVTKVSSQILGNANTVLKALKMKEDSMDANLQLPELIMSSTRKQDD